MKKLAYIFCLCFLFNAQSQEYAFISDSLRLISNEVLLSKGPPKYLLYVFYEDGSKTTLEEVLPLITNRTYDPKMYVNEALEPKALIVIKNK